jgi:hypothetical protein
VKQEAKWWMSASGKVEAKLILIDKPMAQDALTRNPRNRNKSKALIRKYRAKMHAMRWYVTNQGIGFFVDGTLADGQHRLEAIVESGLTQLVLVVTGISIDAAMAIDDLRVRSESDRLKIGGSNDDQIRDRVAIIRAISEVTRSKDQNATLLTEEVAEILDAFQNELTFVLSVLPKKSKGISHSGVRGAMFAAVLNSVDRDKLKRFGEILATGTDAEKNESAAIRLRDYLLTANTTGGSSARKQIFLRTQRALKAFIDGHGITKLYVPEIPIWTCDFLFPEGEKQEAA